MNKRTALSLTAVLSMASAYAQTAPSNTAVPTSTQVKTATVDNNLVSAPVTVNTGTYVGPLSILLAGIAKSAGYDVVFNFNVDAIALIDGKIARDAASSGPAVTPGAAPVTTTTTTNGTTTTAPVTSSNTTATDDEKSYAKATGIPQELGAKPIAYNFVNKPFNEVWPLLMDVYELDYEVIKLGNGNVIRISQRPALSIIKLQNLSGPDAVRRLQQFYGTEILNDSRNPTGKYIFDSITMKASLGSSSKEIVIGGTAEEIKKMTDFVKRMDGTFGNQSQSDAIQVQEIYTVNNNQDDVVTFLATQYPGIIVTPVGKTGKLVLNGSETQINAAKKLLSQVDAPSERKDAINQKVFQLVNASAEEVKATLEGALQKEITSAPAQAGTGTTLLDVNGNPISALVPPSQQASADSQGLRTTPQNTTTVNANPNAAVIIADKRTNTLVVRGTQTQVNQIAELIPQLDKVVPQINVQVRIQEVTDEAVRNLGLNGRINVGGFNISTITNDKGLSASFDPTQSFVGFNIFPTLTALETQNMAKRVYDGNVTMQSGQRSLGNNSQTDNSSSNAAATVKAGGRLEINIPSQAANIPAIQKQIDYGVNLDFINPQVAPDGTITLRVRGQVNTAPSDISPNAIPYVLNFTNSEAQSIVTFKSGETLLLAGLMGQENTKDNRGLPFLSSFGVGGNAITSKKMSQLLVIITGTIVK